MLPTSLRAAGSEKEPDIRRMLCICSPLGIHTPFLFPQKAGRDYDVTPYLEPLQPHREKFTVISGLMHPDVDGGHSAEKSYLTGAAHPGQPSFKNTISIDQYAAERIGHLTRVPSLSLSANNTGLSYTRSGVRIPPETKPSRLFGKLFLEGNAEQKAARMRQIKDGQSIMDLVLDQTKKVTRHLGREDHQTLDQYLTSVRELEKRLIIQEKWAHLPKPKVDREPVSDVEDRADFVSNMELMYELIFLAFRTDSTRLVTFCGAGGNYVPTLKGVDEDWHNLSHHGRDQKKIEKLALIELEEMRLFANFMSRLDEVKEGAHTLLDQTAIFSGSNLGNASSHNNSNLPVIAAGGRFKHGQHLAFNPEDHKTPPLANLFTSHLQHLELEAETFASSKGTLTGL
ncbi:MAG: DUF1552 domain-containing protein [Akkermansiaceae bacterium]